MKGAEACAAALGELFKAWRWDVICIEDTFEAGKVEKQWDTYHAQHSAAVYSWNIHDKLNNEHAAFSATKLSSPNEFDFLRPHAVLAAASRCAFLMLAMLKSQTPSSKYSKSLSFHDSHCVVILTPAANAHGKTMQENGSPKIRQRRCPTLKSKRFGFTPSTLNILELYAGGSMKESIVATLRLLTFEHRPYTLNEHVYSDRYTNCTNIIRT